MRDQVMLRLARHEDFDALESIERAADSLLIELFRADDWPDVTPASERRSYPGFTLIAETSDHCAIGFVQVLEDVEPVHLEQLSVLPAYGRRGIGRMLLGAALQESVRRGHRTVTLRTYREVPWHAPFYTSCGFFLSLPATDFQRMLVDIEKRLGLERWGPRIQMTADLTSERMADIDR